MKYLFKKIEPKWQAKWEESKIFEAKDNSDKPKFYGLVEFPYPSGAGMHVGHIKAYSSIGGYFQKDVVWRDTMYCSQSDSMHSDFLQRTMQLRQEHIHVIITDENITKFSNQLKKVGFSFDWSRVIDTTDEDFYKWTQWIFLKMFENGLVFRDKTLW